MSSDTKNLSIVVEGVSKRYKLKHLKQLSSYLTIRESITEHIGNKFKRLRGKKRLDNEEFLSQEDFWALKNVSFSVNEGERLAILGKNGAGKSTLLKLLSRVTEPTEGVIRFRGRLSSLLEVGAGFHPELTGRENIYFNGAILGMSHKEIQKKFDAIVEFSEVENFLDTPMKRFSSGMYVKLAFSVSAFLEPDILILDEVLSVGDIAFQKKSQQKTLELANEGRTVIFVSHNINAVRSLCDKAIILESGSASEKISVSEAIGSYLTSVESHNSLDFPFISNEVIINSMNLSQEDGSFNNFHGEKPIAVQIDFKLLKLIKDFRIGFYIKTFTGEKLLRSLLTDWQLGISTLQAGNYSLCGHIPANFLVEERFIFELYCAKHGVCNYFDDQISFQFLVGNSGDYNKSHPDEKKSGQVYLDANWKLTHQVT